MVRVSDTAVALLEESRRSRGIRESHGIRIFGDHDSEGKMGIRLAFIDDPQQDDDRIEEHGTEFYVAPEVNTPLAAAVIDVTGQDPPQLTIRANEATG
jgi:Fe-S cluster assembly iron-binding protein IscA